jgi:SAM-dependent methyltransferase
VPPERRGLRRAVAAGLWALAAAHVAEAIVLRRRAGRLVALGGRPPAPLAGDHLDTGTGGAPIGTGRTGVTAGAAGAGATIVARRGVHVGPGLERAAAREMARCGLRVLDLVPSDLPAEQALGLLRRVAPGRFARDWLYAPGGAHQALALEPEVADSIGAGGGDSGAAALAGLTVRAQRHAVRASGVRVTPLVRARALSPEDRWNLARQCTAFASPVLSLAPLLVAARVAHLVVMTAGVAVAPAPGLAAAVTWSGQPALALHGAGATSGLRPPDLVAAGVLRLVRAARDEGALALAGVRSARPSAPAPPPMAPDGPLFGPRQAECPWCGSGDLVRRLDTTDVTGRIPGPIHLDECRRCGHIFQNPVLTDAGLAHCYRDLYDGAGEDGTEAVFAAMAPAYRRRIAAIAAVAAPQSLLDVGTGHGHFCLLARQRWPEATVDGLDQSPSVDEAQRRGWVDRAHRGGFTALAGALPRSYDVVAMSHYLEHTRDPRAELAAAAKVLEPGGLLMIEVPDPASPWARRLGQCWSQWVQPQHLHLVPCANLVAALADEGFDIVAIERAAAHLGGNLVLGLGQAVERRAPCAAHTGRRRLPPGAQLRRATMLAAAAPVAAGALVADATADVVLRRFGGTRPGDAYRVLARRR